ncbi:MAG: winged helix DNA-binding protein, partial [Bacteroidia bacterium]
FISCALGIDKVSMVKIIDTLSKKGLVKRVQNPKDRREYFIELTPKAHKVLPQIHVAIKNLNTEAFKGFAKKEVELFYNLLFRVIENVRDLPASHTLVFKIKKK